MRKVLHVRSGRDDERDPMVFEVETRGRGARRRRVRPPGYEGDGEAACAPSDVVERWFKRLRVTHVLSTGFGPTTDEASIADGNHTIKEYLRWWKRSEVS